MSKPISKEDVILNKKDSIKKLNSLLEGYINSQDTNNLKKANLISYWIKDFVNYISQETKFDPTKLLSYKRGSVIKVNLGFNIGAEYGGLHYAIVLDKGNLHHSQTLTIVPLRSSDNRTIHPRDVDLGSELHNRLYQKNNSLIKETSANIEKDENFLEAMLKVIDKLKAMDSADSTSYLDGMISEIRNNIHSHRDYYNRLLKQQEEINRMKNGSVAKIEQITTVSKQRIYIPKNKNDLLYGISFSKEAMEKINDKIKELYIF